MDADSRIGQLMVRLRQILNNAQPRLIYIPLITVIGAIALSQATLRIDAGIEAGSLPKPLETTVESARAILSALAGGLISSVALLLSMMLVAVQLASSQFSPRTVRNWIGDRTQQRAIGFVLGTVVYCLLVLRQTRTLSEGNALTPHTSVVVAVVLGIVALVAVVRSVDHLTDRLRVGSVASGIMDDTVATIKRIRPLQALERPGSVAAPQGGSESLAKEPPEGAFAVTAAESGWVQQIDIDALLQETPEGSTVYVTTSVGSFTLPNAPLAWVSPAPEKDAECESAMRAAIALGDARTMQQDIGFGILQMVDIALRALSPGVNDPNTAYDIVVHLGVVMLELWERPIAEPVRQEDGRTVVHHDLSHGDFLHAGFDPIRLYGSSDPLVAATMIKSLAALHSETRRRDLSGPVAPIREVIGQITDAVNNSDLSAYDKELVLRQTPSEFLSS